MSALSKTNNPHVMGVREASVRRPFVAGWSCTEGLRTLPDEPDEAVRAWPDAVGVRFAVRGGGGRSESAGCQMRAGGIQVWVREDVQHAAGCHQRRTSTARTGKRPAAPLYSPSSHPSALALALRRKMSASAGKLSSLDVRAVCASNARTACTKGASLGVGIVCGGTRKNNLGQRAGGVVCRRERASLTDLKDEREVLDEIVGDKADDPRVFQRLHERLVLLPQDVGADHHRQVLRGTR